MSILKAALLGKEISHSTSPQVHQALFPILSQRYASKFTGMDYSLAECAEACDVADWIKKAETNGFVGANVTSPYKTDAYGLSQYHIGSSSSLGSGNTLSFNSNSTSILSTDGPGLLSALLREYPEFSLERYHLIALGAGAASKAVLYALCTRWMPKSLTIVNRSREAAEELAEFCIAESPGPSVRVLTVNEFIHDKTESKHRLLLQATPVGSVAHPGNMSTGFMWHDSDFAIDLNYNPMHTPFINSAHSVGAKTLSGLGMLIEQAAFAQGYWMTGVMPDRSALSNDEYVDLKFTLSTLVK